MLEKRLPADPGTAYPVCTPTHEQHEELQDWVGEEYDPDAFSIEDVNRMLTPLRRRRAGTSRGWTPAR